MNSIISLSIHCTHSQLYVILFALTLYVYIRVHIYIYMFVLYSSCSYSLFLGGGIQMCELTEFCGLPGIGKTQVSEWRKDLMMLTLLYTGWDVSHYFSR